MKYVIALFLIVTVLSVKAQFTGTDSLRNYNNRYVTTNPATAFTNNRLNTLLRGIIDFIDTARAGGSGAIQLGIDTVFAVNDSTIRYRKNGVFRQFTLKGVYDSRRKVDTLYKSNDTTLTFTVNGNLRTVIIPGGTNLNLATANQTATGNRTHNWDNHWLYLNNIKSFGIYQDQPDANHVNNNFKTQITTDSSINGTPLQLMWGLRNINDDIIDSVHFELTSTKNGSYLYQFVNGGEKSIEMDWDPFSFYPNTKIYANGNGKNGYYEFGASTTELHPADSITLKAVPAANADSLLAIRALSNGVNTVIKIPSSAITGTPTTLNNIGTGYALVATPGGNIKRINNSYGILIDSTTTANTITIQADTSSTNHLVTQSDLNDTATSIRSSISGLPGGVNGSIQFKNGSSFAGDSLQYLPALKRLFTPRDQIVYGRPVTGFWQDTLWNNTTGRLWEIYPRGSEGTGGDTLQKFYSEMGNTLYDVTQPENPVYTAFAFGKHGDRKPYAAVRLEQDYYNHTEYHAFVTKSRNIPNPNNETRNWSWFVSQIDGSANLTTRSSDNRWNLSIENSPYYDREYAVLDNNHFKLYGINNPTIIGAYGGYLQQYYMAMQVDTTSGGIATLTTGGVSQLNLGDVGIIIQNPSTSSGFIQSDKAFYTNGKEIGAFSLPNSTQVFRVQSSAQGIVHGVSTDGSGFANVNTIGTYFINRDNSISASTRLLGIYNHYNPNDSIMHVRGNGDIWTKGLMTIKTLKTTLTAPATEGTVKDVIADTNGLLSTADRQIFYKGSTTWDPASIGANSSTSTTLTVTGASLGDPVTISKTSGSYSNGEVYFAYVSATNTVTIQLQNVSGGTFDIASATYNVVVLKY